MKVQPQDTKAQKMKFKLLWLNALVAELLQFLNLRSAPLYHQIWWKRVIW